jgi:hypothetical protein
MLLNGAAQIEETALPFHQIEMRVLVEATPDDLLTELVRESRTKGAMKPRISRVSPPYLFVIKVSESM